MKKEEITAKDILQKLINFYAPYFKPAAEWKAGFLQAITGFSHEILIKAYNNTCDYDTKPPSVASFRAYCLHFKSEIELKRHEEQMKADRRTAEAIFLKDGYSHKEYSKACFKNLKLAFKGEVTRQEFIDNCKTLRLNVSDYLNHCDQWGYDMSKEIGSHLTVQEAYNGK